MLEQTFLCLADGTRRAILARLAGGRSLTVGEVAEPFGISLPAVIKHLVVLENAGLLSRQRVGRNVFCRSHPEPLAEAMAWLERSAAFWNPRLDRLAARAAAREAQLNKEEG